MGSSSQTRDGTQGSPHFERFWTQKQWVRFHSSKDCSSMSARRLHSTGFRLMFLPQAHVSWCWWYFLNHFLTSAQFTFGDGKFFSLKKKKSALRMFRNILGLYILVPRWGQPQISPDVAQCPPGVEIISGWEPVLYTCAAYSRSSFHWLVSRY